MPALVVDGIGSQINICLIPETDSVYLQLAKHSLDIPCTGQLLHLCVVTVSSIHDS